MFKDGFLDLTFSEISYMNKNLREKDINRKISKVLPSILKLGTVYAYLQYIFAAKVSIFRWAAVSTPLSLLLRFIRWGDGV